MRLPEFAGEVRHGAGIISLDGNVCTHDTCKRTMVDIFSGSTAKTKRQESEGKQQTVLHNVQIMVNLIEFQFRSQTPVVAIRS